MGGEDSQIFSTTRAVLLEGAWFDPTLDPAYRQGARHAHRSFAPLRARSRHRNGPSGHRPRRRPGRRIGRRRNPARPGGRLPETAAARGSCSCGAAKSGAFWGRRSLWEEVERTLRSLGFVTERRGTEGWRVTPPTFRLDVTREVDLIEEVARHFGYDRLPARMRPAPPRAWSATPCGKKNWRSRISSAASDTMRRSSPPWSIRRRTSRFSGRVSRDPGQSAQPGCLGFALLSRPEHGPRPALESRSRPKRHAPLRVGKTYWMSPARDAGGAPSPEPGPYRAGAARPRSTTTKGSSISSTLRAIWKPLLGLFEIPRNRIRRRPGRLL